MYDIFKHLLSFVFVLVIAHVFISKNSSNNYCFDPVDTDDYASFSPAGNPGNPMQATADNPFRKSSTGLYASGQHNRKQKAESHFSLKFVPQSISWNIRFVSMKQLPYQPFATSSYHFLFYEDHTPPPEC